MKIRTLNNTALFVGAGFSSALGIKTTTQLEQSFINLEPTVATPDKPLQSAISRALRDFWMHVFGWNEDQSSIPTLEDHFTLIDLSANTGHNLGKYDPAKLRAIRRLSIHRVFDILNNGFKRNPQIEYLLKMLYSGENNVIVSTNWDTALERSLKEIRASYNYGVETYGLTTGIKLNNNTNDENREKSILICKLHGSSNWIYCDSCRRIYAGEPGGGKTALNKWIYLKEEDFRSLNFRDKEIRNFKDHRAPQPTCPKCCVELSARLATFSYRKALSFFQFQAVWEKALVNLREANQWIFIGYSIPEADYEIRHLLKTSQLSDKILGEKEIWAVVGNDKNGDKKSRYIKFFGKNITGRIYQLRFNKWFTEKKYTELLVTQK